MKWLNLQFVNAAEVCFQSCETHRFCPSGISPASMAKVLVEINADEGRDAVRLEAEGQKHCLLLGSQPLGEVFREDSFSGVLFVLLPVVLLHPHQPAVILKCKKT